MATLGCVFVCALEMNARMTFRCSHSQAKENRSPIDIRLSEREALCRLRTAAHTFVVILDMVKEAINNSSLC